MKPTENNLTIDIPCKIGSTVYKVITRKDGGSHIQEFSCCGFHIIEAPDVRGHKRRNYIIAHLDVTNSIRHIPFDEINKTVFFSKNEAEQKMNGTQDG